MQDREVSPPVQTLSDDDYVKFKNDLGLAEICIGVKEFKCIGVSPLPGTPGRPTPRPRGNDRHPDGPGPGGVPALATGAL